MAPASRRSSTPSRTMMPRVLVLCLWAMLSPVAQAPGADPTPAVDASPSANYQLMPRGHTFSGPYISMTEAAIGTVATDLAEMAWLARTGITPNPGEMKVTVLTEQWTGHDLIRWQLRIVDPEGKVLFEGTIDPEGGGLAGDGYDLLLRAIFPSTFGDQERGARSPTKLAGLMGDLLDGRLETVLNKSRVVGTRLAERPYDAQLHAEAALVLGAFGLLDMGHAYYDTRPTLCRMSAHLAMVKFLGGGSHDSAELQLATAINGVLLLRESQANAALDGLAKLDPSKESASWSRALRMRMTQDPRLLNGIPDPTPVERREVVAASARTRGFEWTVENQRSAMGEDLYVWRAVNHLNPATTAYGLNLDVLTPAALRRAVETMDLFSGRKTEKMEPFPAEIDMIRATYLHGGMDPSKAEPAVIGWGLVSSFLVRDILECATHAWWRNARELGDGEGGDAVRELVINLLEKSRFTVFFEFNTTFDRALRTETYGRLTTMVRAQPENMPLRVWVQCAHTGGGAYDSHSLGVLGIGAWLTGMVPFGTAYGFNEVAPCYDFITSGAEVFRLGATEESLSLSRHQPQVLALRLAGELSYRKASPDVVREIFGPRSEYDAKGLLLALGQIRSAPKEVLLEVGRRISEIDPGQGSYIAEQFPPDVTFEEKLPFLEAHLRTAPSNIGLSNKALDAVMHYISIDDAESARRWAEMGEEVFSKAGLIASIEYRLHVKDFDGAISVANSLNQRYNDFGMVMVAIVRQIRDSGSSPYRQVLEDHLGCKFPDGLESFTEEYRKSPPRHGMRIRSINGDGTRIGFKPGDTIVACNGYLIPKVKHGYGIVRNMRPPTDLTWVVYRDGKYIDLRGGNKTGRFGIFFEE